MNGPFRLYPTEQHWWSFNDHAAVIARVGAAIRAAGETPGDPFSALEFGPGSSTLALLEGGATRVVTCEDDPHWAGVHRERLVSRFPDQVELVEYTWAPTISIPGVDDQRFDIALIDGPVQVSRRVAALSYAVARAKVVILPMDDSPALSRRLEQLAKSHMITIEQTGPLAGAFATIVPVVLGASGKSASNDEA